MTDREVLKFVQRQCRKERERCENLMVSRVRYGNVGADFIGLFTTLRDRDIKLPKKTTRRL